MNNQTERIVNWHTIAKEVCAVNDANGWAKPTQETFLTKAMLTVTELREAKCSEEPGIANDPLEEELADVAVRLLHVLEAMWPDRWALRDGESELLSVYRPLPVLLWPILEQLCNGTEAWRDNNQVDQRISFEQALGETRSLARALKFDLYAEVCKKVAKNATRGRLHGRANSAG